MDEIFDSLPQDETVVYRARISFGAFALPLISVLILVFLVSKLNIKLITFLVDLAGLFIMMRLVLIYTSTDIVLTTNRLIAKKGVFDSRTINIPLCEVESITVKQTLDGRLLDFGKVTIVGSEGLREAFRAINKPMELQKMVQLQAGYSKD